MWIKLEKNTNNELFKECFEYQDPSFSANQAKNQKMVNQVNHALIHSRNTFKKNEFPKTR